MFNIINAIRTRVRGTAIALACVALAGFALTPKAAADEWDKKTVVTINAPVEIPGKVLPPGTYVFKLLNSASNRNIVQIFDKDEKRLYATILAIPDYRLQPTGKTVIHFEERPTGTPEAIKAWFYPGDVYGQQFVYPHTRAVELAKQSNQNVLSMPNEMTANTTTQAKSASEPSVQAMQKTEVTAVQPSGDQVELAQAVSSKPKSTSEAPQVKSEPKTDPASSGIQPLETASQKHLPKRLPQTASQVPLISLVGMCSLGFALLTHLLRRRVA